MFNLLLKELAGELDFRKVRRGERLNVKGFAGASFGAIAVERGGAATRTPAAADLDVSLGFQMPQHRVEDGGIADRIRVVPDGKVGSRTVFNEALGFGGKFQKFVHQ